MIYINRNTEIVIVSASLFLMVSCRKQEIPIAHTKPASEVAITSAILNGTVKANNAATNVIFEYGTTSSYGQSIQANGPVTGNSTKRISVTLNNLSQGTTYHFKISGRNSVGKTEGDDMIFKTHNSDAVTDIENNYYNIVTIGGQVWMAENLRTTKYRNGEAIGTTSPAVYDIMYVNNPKYQWVYDGNEDYEGTYGRLYTWYVLDDSRKICPAGWHVPGDTEWTILTDFLGGESNSQTALKERGFAPVYGGWRPSGEFFDRDMYGIWWSTSAVENTIPGAIDQIYSREMWNGSKNVYRSYRYKKSGLSVRCLKD